MEGTGCGSRMEELGNTTKFLARIRCLRSEILTWDLQNTQTLALFVSKFHTRNNGAEGPALCGRSTASPHLERVFRSSDRGQSSLRTIRGVFARCCRSYLGSPLARVPVPQNELEGAWKEAVLPKSRYGAGIYLVHHDNRYQDANPLVRGDLM
jgi:hypothetical protein